MVFSERAIGATVFFDADEASTKRVMDASARVRKALQDAKREVNETVSTAEKFQRAISVVAQQDGIKRIGKEFFEATKRGEDLNETTERLIRNLDKLGATDDQIREVAEQYARLANAGRGNDVANIANMQSRGTALKQFGYQLYNLPDIGPSTEISRLSILAGGALERLTVPLSTIALAAPPAALLLVGLGLAIKQFTDFIENGKKQVEGALGAQANYYNAISGGSTSGDIRAELENLQRRKDSLQAQINETQNAADAAFQQTRDAAGNVIAEAFGNSPGSRIAGDLLGDALARGLDAAGLGPNAQLNSHLADLQAQFAEVDGTITRFNQGLENNAFYLADAAEAERLRNEQLQRTTAVMVQTAISGRNMDLESVNDRIMAINNERAVLQTYIDLRQVTAEQQEEFNQRIQALNAELAAILQTVAPGAFFRAQADLEASVQEVFRVSMEKMLAIRAEEARMIGEIEHDRGLKLEEIDRQVADDRAEANRDAQEDESKAYLDHLGKMAKIYRDSSRDIEDAILARDASALYKAQRNRDDAIADENKSYKDRKDTINKRLAETNRDIDRKLIEQKRLINQRYDEQIRIQRAQAQRAVDLENAQANATAAALTNTYNSHVSMLNALQAAAARTAAQVNSSLNSIAPSAQSGPNYTNPTQPQDYRWGLSWGQAGYNWAAGGRPATGLWHSINESGVESAMTNSGMLVRFGTPSNVFNAQQTRQIFSQKPSFNASFHLDGPSERQLKRQFDKSYKKLMKMSRDNYGNI